MLYGSLGLIPLFLLWVYVTWLIVLFGLQVTYTLQAMKGRKFEVDDALNRRQWLSDPRWLICMMALIGESFAKGVPVSSGELSRRLAIWAPAVAALGQLLETEGLVHRVEATRWHDGGYSLAVPPQQIPIAGLLDLGRAFTDGAPRRDGHPTGALFAVLDKAQRDASGDATLAAVLEEQAKAELRTHPG